MVRASIRYKSSRASTWLGRVNGGVPTLPENMREALPYMWFVSALVHIEKGLGRPRGGLINVVDFTYFCRKMVAKISVGSEVDDGVGLDG